MTQGEIWASAEADGGDEFISVRAASGRALMLARSQVSWEEIEGHLLLLHTVIGKKYVLRGSLKSLEQRWSKYGFVRIHNSFLVSLSHVRKLRPTSRGGREAYLSFGAEGRYLPISRRCFQKFKQMWAKHIESQYEKSFS